MRNIIILIIVLVGFPILCVNMNRKRFKYMLIGALILSVVGVIGYFLFPFVKPMKITDENGVEYTVYGTHAEISGYIGNAEVIHCKETVLFRDVTSVAEYAFHKVMGLKEIYFPDNVCNISSMAIHGGPDLEFVHLGANVKELVSCCFYYTPKLTDIELNEGLEWIDYSVFRTLERVVVPSTVIYIGGDAFGSHCDDITFCVKMQRF